MSNYIKYIKLLFNRTLMVLFPGILIGLGITLIIGHRKEVAEATLGVSLMLAGLKTIIDFFRGR